MPVMAVSQAVPAGSASFQQTLIEQQKAAEPASRASAVLEHTELATELQRPPTHRELATELHKKNSSPDCGTRTRKVCRPQFRRTQRASGLRPSRRSLPRGLHGPDRELDRYHALARTSATSATSTLSQRAERAAIYSSLRARAGRELAYVAVARLATPWTLLGTTDAPRRIGFPRLRAAALLSRS